MAELMGLSPEEISGVGTRRSRVEAGQRQQLGMVLDLLGQRSRDEYYGAQTKLTEAKLDKLINPEMTDITIDNQTYSIPKDAFVQSLGYKVRIEEMRRTGRISQAQHDAAMKPITIYMPGPEGKIQPIQTTAGHLEAVSKSIKDMSEARATIMEEQYRAEGLEALGTQVGADVGKIPLQTFFKLSPGAGIAAMQAEARGEAAELEPEERRKLMLDQGKTAQQLLTKKTPQGKKAPISEAEISSYNARSVSLGYPSMLLRYTDIGTFWDTEEAVEVQLPIVGGVQMLPQDIVDDAKTLGISTEDLLKQIYEKMRE